MNRPHTTHWLTSVAAHAGLDLPLPQPLDLASLRRAWPRVVEACRISEEKFTERAAAYFRIGVADLSTWDPHAVRLVPEAIARKHGIVPISFTDDTVVVATSDPTNRAAAQEIASSSDRHPVFLMASPQQLARTLERAYAPARAPRNALQTLVAQVAASDFQVITSSGTGLFTSFELQDPSVVKLAEVILHQAVRYRATEVHVQPGRDGGRVRYRVDGVLQHVVDLPPAAQERLVARLKHLAFDRPGEDPSQGFPLGVPDQPRVGYLLTTPTPDGELVSIRIVNPAYVPRLDELGYDGPEGAKIRDVLRRPEGLVLATGPARSGTTSFVYACLHALERFSVISLETRIEQVVPGLTQIRYDASTGRSFAETLQELLDRNPDVMHAGEIRDLATARISIRAAITGRKVLATLHTADAVSGLRRMLDLGIAGGRLGEACHAVVSLRLVRRLCPACKKPVDTAVNRTSREVKLAQRLGVQPGCRPVGCRTCAGTGYLGELPLAEVLVMSPALRALLAAETSDEELLRAARRDGMRTFTEVGLERVAKGETTLEELERVLGTVPLVEESPEASGPVLLVEDLAEERHKISTALGGMGFEVIEAEDGLSAKRLLDESGQDFSLVLLDFYMPNMNGPELLKEIRRSLLTQALPVIVLSDSSDPQHEIELLEAGADDYLVKPVVEERLCARVRAVLRRAGITLALAASRV